jgi:hypothetical protein
VITMRGAIFVYLVAKSRLFGRITCTPTSHGTVENKNKSSK